MLLEILFALLAQTEEIIEEAVLDMLVQRHIDLGMPLGGKDLQLSAFYRLDDTVVGPSHSLEVGR